MAEPVCDIVLLVWNHREETEACLSALRRNTVLPCRLLIVDNGSDAPTREWLQTIEGGPALAVEVLRNERNLGSPGGFNRGLKASRAPHVVILSNDVQPQAGWLEELLAAATSDPRIGIIGPASNTGGQRPPEGMTLEAFAAQLRQREQGWMGMNFGEFFCLMVARPVIERIGYIDESYGMAYFDDTDYCRRAQEVGFRCVRAKRAYVYHQEGRSLKDTWGRQRQRKTQFDKAAALFASRWGTPERLAYILTGRALHQPQRLAGELDQRLRAFHRIWLYYPGGNGALQTFPEHCDLLRFPQAPARLAALGLWKVLTKKKRFHEVVTDDRLLGLALQALRPIHRGRVRVLAA